MKTLNRSRLHALLLTFPWLFLCQCDDLSAKGPEPSYEGCTSDENWITLDNALKSASAQVGPEQAPIFTEPTSDAFLASDVAAVFRFAPSKSSAGQRDGNVTCPQYQPQHHGGLSPLHLPEVTGTVFDLHVRIDGSDVYRVLTTRQFAGIPLATWRTWTGKTLTVTLYRSHFQKNEIVSGPFRSAPLSVSIK